MQRISNPRLGTRNEGRNEGRGIACGALVLFSPFDFVVYRFLVQPWAVGLFLMLWMLRLCGALVCVMLHLVRTLLIYKKGGKEGGKN